jgi:hypothetical protein
MVRRGVVFVPMVRGVVLVLVFVFLHGPQGHALARVHDFQVRERAAQARQQAVLEWHTNAEKNGRLGERGDLGRSWLEAVRVLAGPDQDVNLHMIAADALDEVRLRRNADEDAQTLTAFRLRRGGRVRLWRAAGRRLAAGGQNEYRRGQCQQKGGETPIGGGGEIRPQSVVSVHPGLRECGTAGARHALALLILRYQLGWVRQVFTVIKLAGRASPYAGAFATGVAAW